MVEWPSVNALLLLPWVMSGRGRRDCGAAETSGHWATTESLLNTGRVAGPPVHDARIAALCITHGVTELLTLDRDFSRFPELTVRSILG